MTLLIEGIELPKTDENGWETVVSLVLSSTGLVELIDEDTNTLLEEYRAVEVPTPHGRLIDADRLEVHDGWLSEAEGYSTHITFVYSNAIDCAPTVIEAEEKECSL